MRTRLPHFDRGAEAAYWIVRLSDASRDGDPFMSEASVERLHALGFKVEPVPPADARRPSRRSPVARPA